MYDERFIIKAMSSVSPTILKVPKNYINLRGITDRTMAAFDVRAVVNLQTAKPEKLIFPYGDEAQKVRFLENKEFTCYGKMSEASLFGKDKFSPGQNMAITITEGELDALSVYQMLGSKYPVVSVRSSSTAREDCSRSHDYINSFDRIYLCLDNDGPGEAAAKKVADLFDINKIYLVNLGAFKDANEMLQAGKEKEFVSVWFNSKRYIPKGIISEYTDIESILTKPTDVSKVSYPFPTLQEMTYGIRSKEVIAILAQEKIGKTEFIRNIEHHILKNTDEKIGIIHLEEDEKRSIQGLIGLHLQQPVHLPDCMVPVSDQFEAYKSLTKTSDRVYFYPHFGSDDPNAILEIIRYMTAVIGCKYIFVDHITMLVTGFEGDDERKKLDFLSTKFLEMTRKLDFTMFLVSHVNDNGLTRGSRNITKVADLIISLSRNIEATDEDSRNTTYVTVRGNRFAGRTGPAGVLRFSPETFTLSELSYANDNTPIEWPDVNAA